MRNYFLSFIAFLAIGLQVACQSQNTLANAPLSQPDPDDPLVISAKTFIDKLAQGDYANAGKDFDGPMQAALTPEKLREVWETLHTKFGAFQGQKGLKKFKAQRNDVVLVKGQWERGALNLRVVFSNKEITGFFLDPPDE